MAEFELKINDAICDFEKGLQNAILIVFKNIKINGCLFHYLKILISKLKKYSLWSCNNKLLITKMIDFFKKVSFL